MLKTKKAKEAADKGKEIVENNRGSMAHSTSSPSASALDLDSMVRGQSYELVLRKDKFGDFDTPILRGLIPVAYKGNKKFTVLLDITINLVEHTIDIHARGRLPNGVAREHWLVEAGTDFSHIFRRQ